LPKGDSNPRVVIITKNVVDNSKRTIIVGQKDGDAAKTKEYELSGIATPEGKISLNEAFIGGFISQLAQQEKGSQIDSCID